eukprot:3161223-Pyramimonas_sp.AAC.1
MILVSAPHALFLQACNSCRDGGRVPLSRGVLLRLVQCLCSEMQHCAASSRPEGGSVSSSGSA